MDAVASLAGIIGTIALFVAVGRAANTFRTDERIVSRRNVADGLIEQAREEILRSYKLSQSHNQLRGYVRHAASALARRVVESPPTFDRPPTSPNRIDYVKDLVRWAVRRYGLTMPPIKVRFRQEMGAHAGSVFRDRDGIWAVDIDATYERDDAALALIVAHEVAHIVLGERRVALDDSRKNEELTDATAVMAGFGPEFVRGGVREAVHHQSDEVGVRIARLGYLPPQAIAYLTALQVEIAGGSALEFKDRVAHWLRPAVDEYLLLRKAWERKFGGTMGGEAPCFGCGTMFRLPAEPRRVRVRCPHCCLSREFTLAQLVS